MACSEMFCHCVILTYQTGTVNTANHNTRCAGLKTERVINCSAVA